MLGNLLYGFTTFFIFFFSLNSDIDILPFSNIVKESSLFAKKPKYQFEVQKKLGNFHVCNPDFPLKEIAPSASLGPSLPFIVPTRRKSWPRACYHKCYYFFWLFKP